ncbi:MAG: glycosyltransferase, partial [Oscillibacter sp.]|nr:glycosyltransferase [Oscillibacter sp.]
MKFLNIISDTNIGGAGRVLLNYLQYANKEDFETAVAVPRGSLLAQPLRDLGAAVYEVDGMVDRSYHKDDVKALMTLIREVDPDIVHTHGALSGRIAGRRCGKIVIFTRHSAFPVSAKLRYPPGRWVNKLLNEHYSDH